MGNGVLEGTDLLLYQVADLLGPLLDFTLSLFLDITLHCKLLGAEAFPYVTLKRVCAI